MSPSQTLHVWPIHDHIYLGHMECLGLRRSGGFHLSSRSTRECRSPTLSEMIVVPKPLSFNPPTPGRKIEKLFQKEKDKHATTSCIYPFYRDLLFYLVYCFLETSGDVSGPWPPPWTPSISSSSKQSCLAHRCHPLSLPQKNHPHTPQIFQTPVAQVAWTKKTPPKKPHTPHEHPFPRHAEKHHTNRITPTHVPTRRRLDDLRVALPLGRRLIRGRDRGGGRRGLGGREVQAHPGRLRRWGVWRRVLWSVLAARLRGGWGVDEVLKTGVIAKSHDVCWCICWVQ